MDFVMANEKSALLLIYITQDGTYILNKRQIVSNESAIYISGDNPNGTFQVGIIDIYDNFLEIPNGIINESTKVFHGSGVILAVKVVGYAGTETRIGVLGR